MGPKTFDTPPGSKDSPGVGKMSSFAHLNGKHISGTIKPVSREPFYNSKQSTFGLLPMTRHDAALRANKTSRVPMLLLVVPGTRS